MYLVLVIIILLMLAKIINRLFHQKSTKQPCRSQGNTKVMLAKIINRLSISNSIRKIRNYNKKM